MKPDARPTGAASPGQHSHRRPVSPESTTAASVVYPVLAEPVVIDCDQCSMRGLGCGDCMVTVLLGGPPLGVSLDEDERHAIDVLADAGLIPPLRMVNVVDSVHMVSE